MPTGDPSHAHADQPLIFFIGIQALAESGRGQKEITADRKIAKYQLRIVALAQAPLRPISKTRRACQQRIREQPLKSSFQSGRRLQRENGPSQGLDLPMVVLCQPVKVAFSDPAVGIEEDQPLAARPTRGKIALAGRI